MYNTYLNHPICAPASTNERELLALFKGDKARPTMKVNPGSHAPHAATTSDTQSCSNITGKKKSFGFASGNNG